MENDLDDPFDENGILKDGRGISLPFLLRDAAKPAPPVDDGLRAGDVLRDIDTGRPTLADAMMVAAIRAEAAKAKLPTETYCRARLRYRIERAA